MKLISHFIFRLSPAYLVVFAGVLNNTVESSEDTKEVREVTEIFLHEEYDEETLTNDIAIIKVGLLSMYEK
jgi:secreted trypsin-like serine protease